MPDGARKMHLDGVLRDQQAALFGPRIVAFAEREAQAYATIVSRAKRDGKAISIVDGQIAATALAGGFCIASRDRRPFEAAGLRVINPWTVPAPP
jgi:predicted nucleic acid-binding protein